VSSNSKILSESQLLQQVKQWKAAGEKIVFTNGCFDVFHYGHLQLLFAAKQWGSKLLVALNSDVSVRLLKGEDRPINSEQHRAALLAALTVVDAVVLFSEETPEILIQKVIPDVLVKGGDYKPSQIIGADTVIKHGGEVKIVPLEEGFSSSKILTLLKRN